jgi:hypothetical protein
MQKAERFLCLLDVRASGSRDRRFLGSQISFPPSRSLLAHFHHFLFVACSMDRSGTFVVTAGTLFEFVCFNLILVEVLLLLFLPVLVTVQLLLAIGISIANVFRF